MIGIFNAKINWLIRNPWTFLLMTGMSIIFAFIIGGSNSFDKIKVPVYAHEDSLYESDLFHHLEEQKAFTFEKVTKEELEQKIMNGNREFGLLLAVDDFQVIVGMDSPSVNVLEQAVNSAYIKEAQMNELQKAVPNVEDIQAEFDNLSFQLETAFFQGNDTFIYNSSLHTLFGFSLFFVIYTIGYSVFQILLEKKSGVWDRMILSPIRKWEMYVANFLYSFLIGYTQVLIVFFIFRYLVDVDFQGTFFLALLVLIPYVLAIVALSILITGIVKTTQQFNAVIPIVALSMAMIGGAYWPLEIVESKFMLFLAKFVPITYGMEALNGVTLYGYGVEQILYPVSILLLMSVVMTGIGIHLMERRYIS